MTSLLKKHDAKVFESFSLVSVICLTENSHDHVCLVNFIISNCPFVIWKFETLEKLAICTESFYFSDVLIITFYFECSNFLVTGKFVPNVGLHICTTENLWLVVILFLSFYGFKFTTVVGQLTSEKLDFAQFLAYDLV